MLDHQLEVTLNWHEKMKNTQQIVLFNYEEILDEDCKKTSANDNLKFLLA